MIELPPRTVAYAAPVFVPQAPDAVVVGGDSLTVADVARVAAGTAQVQLTQDPAILDRVAASCAYIANAVRAGEPIYGVTSGFGGMANVTIAPQDAAALQSNLIWYHKAGSGALLSRADVRASMLLRLNSHLRGASGIRLEMMQRIVAFLNANVTPHLYEFGSIGASGDLVPLSYMAGALTGLDERYLVDFDGETLAAPAALTRLGLAPLQLLPKEGLAMMNGTAVMSGIAANVVADARALWALAFASHALMIQALGGTNQSFHPFIHALKAHPGQIWSADCMLALLEGSQLVRDELDGRHDYRANELIQDRYSLRCLPQYMGPLVDSLAEAGRQIEIEINSATDNPLIDGDLGRSYHGGNFLGQYVSAAMDRLRSAIGLLAKHLDTQIALLVTPQFNNGLPACLVGNPSRSINMGLKGLQIAGNSLVPMLTFLGNSIADHYLTHAEQFNQNINSQGFNAATLARRSVEIFQIYMAHTLIFGMQAADLKSFALTGQYDARAVLSPATAHIYTVLRELVDSPPSAQRPYIWDDRDRPLDADIARISGDIASGGRLAQAVGGIIASLVAQA